MHVKLLDKHKQKIYCRKHAENASIGAGAQSTSWGTKCLPEKSAKCPNFASFLPEKLSKYPTFYDIFPKISQNSRILHDFCPKNVRILHNNCPKNIFSRILGGYMPPPFAPVSYACEREACSAASPLS